ncbi:hypothetical protein ACLJB6_02675 [Campylobacter coli]|uniref:hypothetical protein n=1 Tax=Campylobacter coli TaxID=195 RepID=UPI0036F2443F|nr:hypothetical protein [Campylobacter coli]
MTNVEKISEFLTQAKVFTFLTVDNGQPKGRPFGFHLSDIRKMGSAYPALSVRWTDKV